MIKIMAALIIHLITVTDAQAGLVALTHHSRANCINNETISWHKGHAYWLKVQGDHMESRTGQIIHSITNNKEQWENTWRAAAVCWGEGRGGWIVRGIHHLTNHPNKSGLIVTSEIVADCSLYNGWWDK